MPAAAAVPIAVSVVGMMMNANAERKRAAAARPLADAQTKAAQAQAAEIAAANKRREELSDHYRGVFQGAGSAESPEGRIPDDWYQNLVRSAGLRGMGGLAPFTGSGVLDQLGQQNFLEGAQGQQDLAGSAQALSQSVLDWVAQRGGGGGDGSYAGYVEPRSVEDMMPIQPIAEPGTDLSGGVPDNPFLGSEF